MSEQTRPLPEKEPVERPPEPSGEVAPGLVHANASPLRCPYCHESIDLAGEEWLACEGCLARHHESCWRESRRCSSCGSERSLARQGAADARADAASFRQEVQERARDAGVQAFAFMAGVEAPPGGASPIYESVFGAPRTIEVTRTLPGNVPGSRVGSWGNFLFGVSIANEGDSTRIRVAMKTGPFAGGIFGGGVGGGAGGLGGGLTYVVLRLLGPKALIVWYPSVFLVAFVIARLAFRSVVARHRERLERLADDLAQAIGSVREAGKGPAK